MSSDTVMLIKFNTDLKNFVIGRFVRGSSGAIFNATCSPLKPEQENLSSFVTFTEKWV